MPNAQRLFELALIGLHADRARIDDEIAQIKGQLKGGRGLASGSPSTEGVTRTGRTMSAAARKRISEGMKRRYAAMRAASESPRQGKQTHGVGLTTAGRKKLSEMMKARWAAKRKAAKK
jgi:hypothetical protein